MAKLIGFESADNPGTSIAIEAHAQVAVTEGEAPGTAVIHTPDGRRYTVVGDYREVEAKLQAAAAQAHESGTVTTANRPVS